MEKELFTCNIRKFHETETVKKIPDISLYALLSKQFLYLLKGKPFLYFYKRKLSHISGNRILYFLSPSPKTKKITPKKSSLYSRKWNFLALILKNLIFPRIKPYTFWSCPSKFFPEKNFLYFFLKHLL